MFAASLQLLYKLAKKNICRAEQKMSKNIFLKWRPTTRLFQTKPRHQNGDNGVKRAKFSTFSFENNIRTDGKYGND